MKLWIARDKYGRGTLTLHLFKPLLNKYGRWTDNTFYGFKCVLAQDDFPDVTFENSPQEVELKLVNDIVNDFAEDLLTNCKPLEGELSKFIDDNFDNLI